MSYQAAEARRLDRAERAQAQAPTFDVIEGGGIDARVRRGVAADFVARVRLAALAMAVFVALGAARVSLTTATVTCLRANLQTKVGIEQAQALNSELRIERSVLSSTTRITRIATQNYGMVYATSHDRIDMAPAVEPSAAEAPVATVQTASSTSPANAQGTLEGAVRVAPQLAMAACVRAASNVTAGS